MNIEDKAIELRGVIHCHAYGKDWGIEYRLKKENLSFFERLYFSLTKMFEWNELLVYDSLFGKEDDSSYYVESIEEFNQLKEEIKTFGDLVRFKNKVSDKNREEYKLKHKDDILM